MQINIKNINLLKLFLNNFVSTQILQILTRREYYK